MNALSVTFYAPLPQVITINLSLDYSNNYLQVYSLDINIKLSLIIFSLKEFYIL